MTATIVYTDGACQGNPGPGGWAWAIPQGRWAAGTAAHTTNQRMELTAVLEAVTTLDNIKLDVVSDSTYVVNCFRDRWWEGWLERNWTNKAKKPIANRDLWEPLLDEYRRDQTRIAFRWVKGHSDDVMNDLVDRLAVKAAQEQRRTEGDQPPDDAELPAPDDAASPNDARVPQGRKIAIVGHKPPQLGGYDEANATAAKIRARLADILGAKKQLHPDLVVLTGLDLGAPQLAAEAARAANVPFVAVLPFPDPESVWPKASQLRFRALRDAADNVVLLQAKQPESKQKAGAGLARRDGWIVRHADEAIAVWDRQDAAVGKLVRSLNDSVGEEEVWIVEPER